jgi:vacuolar protein sorting-associated protein 13A/C
VLRPLEGAQKGGVGGFVGGVGVGLAGAVVKPVAGVIDLVNKVSHYLSSFGTCDV